MQRLPDGRLQVGFHIVQDSATDYGLPPGIAVSDDDGKSWKEMDPEIAPASWMSKILNLPNGDHLHQIRLKPLKISEIQELMPPSVAAYKSAYGNSEIKVYPAEKVPNEFNGFRFARLPKGGDKWVEESAVLNIPGMIRMSLQGILIRPWIHRIKLAPDGSLWGFGHGKRIVGGSLQRQRAVQIMRSKDQGRTWNLISEIPYLPDKNADIFWNKRSGFGEPDIVFLPDRSLLCLLRVTDGNGVGPLYASRSTDEGNTWCRPKVFDDLGVWPILLTMKSGVTLASYGRPGLFIRASADPGAKLWGDRITIVEPGKYHRDTCSYSDMIALDDHTALIVYSDFNFPDKQGRPRKTILTRKIHLQ